jgi:carbon storage regulator
MIGELFVVKVLSFTDNEAKLQVTQKDSTKDRKVIVDIPVGNTYILPENIEILVMKRRGNQLKIGITAPSDVAVHREEIYEKIQNEKQANQL